MGPSGSEMRPVAGTCEEYILLKVHVPYISETFSILSV
jgi:hypothetical protein